MKTNDWSYMPESRPNYSEVWFFMTARKCSAYFGEFMTAEQARELAAELTAAADAAEAKQKEAA